MMLALVLIGHLIGDWIIQTDWQAANKVRPEEITLISGTSYRRWMARSWKANQQHMLGYHLTLGIVLAVGGTSWSVLSAIVAVSWVTHSFIDRRWPVRWLMAHTGSEKFSQTTFGVIAVDQALHLSILAALAAAALG